MKRNYETFELTVIFLDEEDIVRTSLNDGVNIEWDDGWNTGTWAEQ